MHGHNRCRQQALGDLDASCWIHIQVEAARFNVKALRNLAKIVNKQERLIEHALGISAACRARW